MYKIFWEGTMFYTTYFANVKNLPSTIVPVSISLYSPPGWTGFEYKRLAPLSADFKRIKATGNVDGFIEDYIRHTLQPLVIKDTVQEIIRLVGSQEIALVCYEGADKFCHRHIVSHWISSGGFLIREFGRRGESLCG